MKSVAIGLLLVFVFLISGCVNEKPSILGKNTMIFVAHQDDETIGAGTIMSRIVKNGGDVTVVITTDGAPEEFGHGEIESQIRKNETIKALSLIGVPEQKVVFLNYDDLGFIFEISLEAEIEKIKRLIQEKSPDTIFVQAYEGGHIDHDATHFLVVQAVKKSGLNIDLYEFPEYNAFNWGKPIPDEEDTIDNKKYPVIILNLTEEEQQLKKEALKQYVSQKPVKRLAESRTAEDTGFSILQRRGPGMTEYDFFLQRLSPESADRASAQSREERCSDDYLVCTYYWPDMIRKLPKYEYQERPHDLPPELLYEEFLKNKNMTNAFDSFKNIITTIY